MREGEFVNLARPVIEPRKTLFPVRLVGDADGFQHHGVVAVRREEDLFHRRLAVFLALFKITRAVFPQHRRAVVKSAQERVAFQITEPAAVLVRRRMIIGQIFRAALVLPNLAVTEVGSRNGDPVVAEDKGVVAPVVPGGRRHGDGFFVRQLVDGVAVSGHALFAVHPFAEISAAERLGHSGVLSFRGR
ncbi:MAG: hypothetical protein BWY37_02181 [Firmicutes bacterium ADurb.Bin262]|nr:MAG: hypothetical protein BWY37_02181 [Firmicutes bacterium ADurb.Bin262]